LPTAFTLEGLTQVIGSADGRALPRLAESWTWENGGRTLRLKLRPGVVFHDGISLTAIVAAEALRRAIARPGNLALYPSLSDITAVRPDGDFQVLIELSQPSAFLPEELDLPLSTGPQNVGTGAFRLVRRDASGVLLERFEQYYLGAPEIEEIVIRPFDTLRTAWTSLLRGDVDMVTDVPPEAVEFIRNDEIQVISFARRYQFLVAFNSQKQPFTSPVVRRALNAAIDRNALIENVLQGQGEPATGPLWPKHWAYDPSIQPYSFDPQTAVSLLEATGFRIRDTARTSSLPPARLRFTCLLPADFTLLERIGLEVQKQLYDIGVDMQFEVVPAQEYDARIRAGQFQAVLIDMISGPTFGRPFIFWRSARAFKGLNVFGYENPEAERLFQVLRTSMNEAAVRSATRRLQSTLLEDPPALFLAWNERARAVSRRFLVADKADRDPLLTIRQWTENTDREPIATQ
jgi:peptide/nickel transport system substrate-binding protein